MKLLPKFMLSACLVVMVPALAARPVGRETHGKSYEEMTPKEIREEVQHLQEQLMASGVRLSGMPLPDDVPEARQESGMDAETPAQSDQPVFSGSVYRSGSGRKLRTLSPDMTARMQQSSSEQIRRQRMRHQLKQKATQFEQGGFTQSEASKPVMQESESHLNSSYDYERKNAGFELREYVIDLPVIKKESGTNRKKKVKIRIRPGIMPLHKQVQDLNKILIDDVVRLTGKSLKK